MSKIEKSSFMLSNRLDAFLYAGVGKAEVKAGDQRFQNAANFIIKR